MADTFCLSAIMCFFEQTVWQCSHWDWGALRKLCPNGQGTPCSLRLIFESSYQMGHCGHCGQVIRMENKISRLEDQITAWEQVEGTDALIERARQLITLFKHDIRRSQDKKLTEQGLIPKHHLAPPVAEEGDD